MIPSKPLVILFLLGSILFDGQAQPEHPVFVHSTSPNGKYTLTLSAGELNIQHGDEQQTLNAHDGYASERGELGSIAWSADSQFLLITRQAGAHDQYTEQILYQGDETGFGKFKAWSFHEVTLLNRLGAFALVDPDHGTNRYAVASITLDNPRPDIIVKLWPVGRNRPFDAEADHYYKVHVLFLGAGFRVMQIIREPGEGSKEPARIVWQAK